MIESTATAVTYLFSDIEGSTRLWESEPARAARTLAWHDELSRTVVQRHHGTVVKMTGDGLHAAFDDPVEAVAAVLELQIGLASTGVDLAPLSVRCGLHMGADQRRDNDYFGPAVNRAARIMSAAHGGQVLLSAAVAGCVAGRLPASAMLRDLGLVRLRDLSSPEQLFQLVHPSLRAEFPALRSLASTPNNLPQQISSFVGREHDMEQVHSLLRKHRLVTLLAMGGIGKSRLSVQLGADVLDEFADGVWLVELAPLVDGRELPQAVATVLGVKVETGSSLLDALVRHVQVRQLLLLLDNCEHVIQAAADLAKALLQAGPGVKILATTRDALQLAGEAVYHLQPLPVPTAQDVAPAQLAQHASVQLFLDRATSVQPSFKLTDRLAGPVAEICRRLDGIPLALELAAARARSLPVEAIAARLDQRFRVLIAGDRTVLPRQRTLRALIDWSHDLLTAEERAVFRRLSVFAGGWTVAAAEAVAAGSPVAMEGVLDTLSSLVEKSLVVMDIESGRYRMLDTVRHYAREQLEQSGEGTLVRDRHLDYFVALTEEARPALTGPDQTMWLGRLDKEGDDILSAHQHARVSPTGGPSDLRLAFAMRPYFIHRGLVVLGYQFAVEALAHPGAQSRDLLRCQALHVAGQLCCFLGRYPEAINHLTESAAIADEIGDATRRMAVEIPLGMAYHGLGDLPAARGHFERSVQLAEALGNAHQILAALNGLAQVLRASGDNAQARSLYERVLAAARAVGDSSSTAIALLNLCMVAIDAGHGSEARGRLLEVMTMAAGGQVAQSALEVSVGLAARRQEWALAAELFGTAEALTLRTGLRRDGADEAFLGPLMEQTRAALGPERYAKIEESGRCLPLPDALSRARTWLETWN